MVGRSEFADSISMTNTGWDDNWRERETGYGKRAKELWGDIIPKPGCIVHDNDYTWARWHMAESVDPATPNTWPCNEGWWVNFTTSGGIHNSGLTYILPSPDDLDADAAWKALKNIPGAVVIDPEDTVVVAQFDSGNYIQVFRDKLGFVATMHMMTANGGEAITAAKTLIILQAWLERQSTSKELLIPDSILDV